MENQKVKVLSDRKEIFISVGSNFMLCFKSVNGALFTKLNELRMNVNHLYQDNLDFLKSALPNVKFGSDYIKVSCSSKNGQGKASVSYCLLAEHLNDLVSYYEEDISSEMQASIFNALEIAKEAFKKDFVEDTKEAIGTEIELTEEAQEAIEKLLVAMNTIEDLNAKVAKMDAILMKMQRKLDDINHTVKSNNTRITKILHEWFGEENPRVDKKE